MIFFYLFFSLWNFSSLLNKQLPKYKPLSSKWSTGLHPSETTYTGQVGGGHQFLNKFDLSSQWLYTNQHISTHQSFQCLRLWGFCPNAFGFLTVLPFLLPKFLANDNPKEQQIKKAMVFFHWVFHLLQTAIVSYPLNNFYLFKKNGNLFCLFQSNLIILQTSFSSLKTLWSVRISVFLVWRMFDLMENIICEFYDHELCYPEAPHLPLSNGASPIWIWQLHTEILINHWIVPLRIPLPYFRPNLIA